MHTQSSCDHYHYVVPSGPPLNLTSTSTTSRNFTLQWLPPSDDLQNGIINYYLIEISVNESNEILNLMSESLNFTVTSLHPAYTYNCSVAAVTIGVGPYSDNHIVTTEEEGKLCCIHLSY